MDFTKIKDDSNIDVIKDVIPYINYLESDNEALKYEEFSILMNFLYKKLLEKKIDQSRVYILFNSFTVNDIKDFKKSNVITKKVQDNIRELINNIFKSNEKSS